MPGQYVTTGLPRRKEAIIRVLIASSRYNLSRTKKLFACDIATDNKYIFNQTLIK